MNKKLLCIIHRILLLGLILFSIYGQKNHILYAQEKEYLEFENPEDIILTAPKDGFTTTAERISILGACDYRFPLFMNGEELKTTDRGFFTVYYELKVGENKISFSNNGKIKDLTIIRKKPSTSHSSGSGSGQPVEKIYNEDVYGKVVSKYAMPRKSIGQTDLSLYPISRGTTAVLTGESGSYYKLENGWYLSKASVTKYSDPLKQNKVSKTSFNYEPEEHVYVTHLQMEFNTLYEVSFAKEKVVLKLYHTNAAREIEVPKNSLVEEISMSQDSKKNTVTYTYKLYPKTSVYGYDVFFNDGAMKFELKEAPHFKKKGSLSGVTIFVDAGHGGKDTGALGPLSVYGPVEKDTNLAVALALKESLVKLGAKVVMSRTDDTYYSLSDRVSKIRNSRPDLSISIHANSLAVTSDYGANSGLLTYYSYNINDASGVAQINRDIANIMKLEEHTPRINSLSLTRLTSCPAFLIETQFMSNPSDYEFLIQEKNQKAFGAAIARAVLRHFEEIGIYPQSYYVVKPGDSLLKIARSYHVSLGELVQVNNIKNIDYIYVGQKLKIPEN